MGDARRKKRAGRARLSRLRKDHAVIGDARRYAQAHALASSANPERSLVPSNWDQVIGRVERFRRLYKHLEQGSMARWYKAMERARIESKVTINGEEFSLADLRKITAVAAEIAEDPERARQLAQLAAETRGEVWIQTIE